MKEAEREKNQLQKDEEAKEAWLERFKLKEPKQGIDPTTLIPKHKGKHAEFLQDRDETGDDVDDNNADVEMVRTEFRLYLDQLEAPCPEWVFTSGH